MTLKTERAILPGVYTSAASVITAVLVAATGIYSGLSLAIYAERDDAPGGVVIGTILMFGSLALGLWIALRQARKPSRSAVDSRHRQSGKRKV
jgi:membrane protein DedA with SNARE-associated domain